MHEDKLIQNIKNKVASLEFNTGKIHISDIRLLIQDLKKLEVSLTKESSLIMMGVVRQSSSE